MYGFTAGLISGGPSHKNSKRTWECENKVRAVLCPAGLILTLFQLSPPLSHSLPLSLFLTLERAANSPSWHSEGIFALSLSL